ncbi:MAG: hypothetical protein KGQ60_09965, partial [Planctomycetes bacterium]|nr:hypothetical protein [Planctomycetota bacterium]
FGGESQSTLGSAVFRSPDVLPTSELESFSFSSYKSFVGKSWQAFGEENWSKPWLLLFERPQEANRNLLQEIASVNDPATALAGSQLTENHDSPTEAVESLKAVFDSDRIQELRIYRVGDSEAITGILIAALTKGNQPIVLLFLMD